jgi:hypothetical protein
MPDEYFLLICDDVPHDVVLTTPAPASWTSPGPYGA